MTNPDEPNATTAVDRARAAQATIQRRLTESRLGKSTMREMDADMLALRAAGEALDALIAERLAGVDDTAEDGDLERAVNRLRGYVDNGGLIHTASAYRTSDGHVHLIEFDDLRAILDAADVRGQRQPAAVDVAAVIERAADWLASRREFTAYSTERRPSNYGRAADDLRRYADDVRKGRVSA